MGSLRRDRQRAAALGPTIVTYTPLKSGWLKCNDCGVRIKQGKTHGHAKSHEPARAPRPPRAKLNLYDSWDGWRHHTRGYVYCPMCYGRNNVNESGEILCAHCRKNFIAEE